MDILSEKTVKARKAHQCGFCTIIIPKGAIYTSQVNTADGIGTFKAHTSCLKLAHKLDMFNEAEDGVDSDLFCEIIEDKYNELFPDVIGASWPTMIFSIKNELL